MLTETQLLNHIYQTAEMGREGIHSVLRYTSEPRLVNALSQQLSEYEQLQSSAGAMLHARGEQAKVISPVANLSSEVISSMKALTDSSPTKIAEMMIQGSTMGVTKSLRNIRDCTVEDEEVRNLANKLVRTEQNNIEQMKQFL